MADGSAKAGGTPLEFTEEQRRIIRDSFANGASDAEFAVLMEVARLRRLNPFTRQIHFIKRWDDMKKREVWSYQVSIDGLRAIAERTGLYDGQDEAECVYDGKGRLQQCKVRVYRKDWGRPSVGVAHFPEYAQTKRDGGLTRMWAEKPHVMLAKCAEALALRKAFPEDTSGLYVPQGMGQQEEMREEAQQRAAKQAPASKRMVDSPVEPSPAGALALPAKAATREALELAAAELATPRGELAERLVEVASGERRAPSEAAPREVKPAEVTDFPKGGRPLTPEQQATVDKAAAMLGGQVQAPLGGPEDIAAAIVAESEQATAEDFPALAKRAKGLPKGKARDLAAAALKKAAERLGITPAETKATRQPGEEG